MNKWTQMGDVLEVKLMSLGEIDENDQRAIAKTSQLLIESKIFWEKESGCGVSTTGCNFVFLWASALISSWNQTFSCCTDYMLSKIGQCSNLAFNELLMTSALWTLIES